MPARKITWLGGDIAVLLLILLNLNTYFQDRPTRPRDLKVDQPNSADVGTASPIVDYNQSGPHNNRSREAGWIGDYWIPPTFESHHPQRFYSAQEFRRFFANESILFVGDSTARRVFTTLYHILESTDQNDWDMLRKSEISDPRVIDVNRAGQRTERCDTNEELDLCRKMPMNPDMHADLAGLTCNSHVVQFFQRVDSSPYTLIVLAYGQWHQAQRCRDDYDDKWMLNKGGGEAALQAINAMKTRQRDDLTIVFRSIAMPMNPGISLKKNTRRTNQFFLKHIRKHEEQYWNRTGRLSSLTALDWGTVMEPRTISVEDRIEGDMPFHFGFESRLVFLQMLMHHLVVRRKQKELLSLTRKLSY